MSPKYVALIFIREFVMFSALSCLPAGPSLSPLSRASPSPGAAALGSEGAGFPIPSAPPPQIREQEATRGLLQGLCRLPQLPKLGPPFGGEWRLLRRRGGRARAGSGREDRVGKGPPRAALAGKGPLRCPPGAAAQVRARRGPVPAEPAAAGRGRLGHALFIAEPPARPRRRRLPRLPRAGSGLRGGAGARSLHNIVAAPRVTAQGRRGCAALAAGGGRCDWEGSGVGAMTGHAAPRGARAGRGCVA